MEVTDVSAIGAEYTTDDNGQISATDLKHNNTYYIFETATRPGYNIDSTVYTFTIDENGLIDGKDHYDLTITNQADVVEISKRDITTDEELPGATLTITDKDGFPVKDSYGNEIESWVSTNEPHIIKGIPAGEYILTEVTAPDGYAIATAVPFTINDTLELQKVVMVDERLTTKISKKDITTQEELPGATLQVIDITGAVIDEWVSTDKPHEIYLPDGTYTLKETIAPDGYVTAEEITFAVVDSEVETTVEMFDNITTLSVSKLDITDGEELPGATLTITDKLGNVIETWVSTEEPHIIEKIPVGEYILTEESAPDGYAIASSIAFEVKDTGEVQKVTMVDKPLKIEIAKTDMTTGKDLPGATLRVTDADGNIVDEWVSGDKPHPMNLPAGEYTLTEISAPDGYTVAESVKFTVSTGMKVQRVEMVDGLIRVEISKKDITGDDELPGATLQVRDKEGNLIDEWVSGKEPHMMNISVGEYYPDRNDRAGRLRHRETITFTARTPPRCST